MYCWVTDQVSSVCNCSSLFIVNLALNYRFTDDQYMCVLHVCACACACMHVYACVCACMCVHMHAHVYIAMCAAACSYTTVKPAAAAVYYGHLGINLIIKVS